MKTLTAIIISLCICTVTLAQKSRFVESEVAVRDVEIKKIPRWQVEYGQWERYRRGDFDNLRLTSLDGKNYVLSRTYAMQHRSQQGSFGITPVFAFHYHTIYNGAVLDEKQVLQLQNIQPGDTLKIESRTVLNDMETHTFEEYLGTILSQRNARRPGFFLWVTRTANKKKDVIRIVDTDEVIGFKVLYWELPYKTFMTLFDTPAGKGK